MIEVDGYRVNYVEAGAGPAILMLHGFGGTTATYRKVIPRLSRDHRCIAVDLKGVGYSERDAMTGLSHTDQAAMLAGLLDRLDDERAVVIGHSMGGAVAQRFATTYPERVEALVLAASVPADRRLGRGAVRIASFVRPVLPVLEGIAALAAPFCGDPFYDRSLLTPELREMYLVARISAAHGRRSRR